MKARFLVLFFLSVLVWGSLPRLHAQAQDTLLTLSPQELFWYIETYHPVAKQANLLGEQGQQMIRKARGAFDPELKSNYDQKAYDGKNYFRELETALVIPTWYGVDIKAGYDRTSGIFLSPEDNLPDPGLWSAGVSVPIGQGLFYDQRRLAVQQAQVFAQANEAERINMLNDIFYDAIDSYWMWVNAWNQLQVFEQAVELAEIRFEGIKTSFLQGDLPAIDTLEAFILLQNRQLSYNESLLAYRNETLHLSNFLWYDGNVPLEITDRMIPVSDAEMERIRTFSREQLDLILRQLAVSHPEIRLYDYKITDLELQQRWKREKLKPKLNVEYNMLSNPRGEVLSSFNTNNYKWGFSFSLPLFLRSARGDLELNKLKIQDAEFGREQKLLEITNKVKSYHNDLETLEQQVELYIDVSDNYQRLFQAEQQKFRLGESSIFLLNSREVKYIEAQLKLIELEAKYQKSFAAMMWAAGQLFEQ